MNVLNENLHELSDQSLLEGLKPLVAKLSPAGRRELLAVIARDCLGSDVAEIPLIGDEGDIFAHVYPANPPAVDWMKTFSEEQRDSIMKNLFDPKYHMTVEELLAALEEEDAQESQSQESAPRSDPTGV